MSSDIGVLGFLTSQYVLTNPVNLFFLLRVYDNSSANNFTLVCFALSPYFDRDGIHKLKNCKANIYVKYTITTASKRIE